MLSARASQHRARSTPFLSLKSLPKTPPLSWSPSSPSSPSPVTWCGPLLLAVPPADVHFWPLYSSCLHALHVLYLLLGWLFPASLPGRGLLGSACVLWEACPLPHPGCQSSFSGLLHPLHSPLGTLIPCQVLCSWLTLLPAGLLMGRDDSIYPLVS